MLSTKQTKKKVCVGSQFVYLCLYPPNTKKWDKKLTNKKEDLHLADNHCWCPPIAQRDQCPTWRSSWWWLSRWTSQHWSPTWLSERRCDHIGHTPGTHSADCSNVFILIDHCWVWWVWWKRPLWQAKLLSCHDIHHPESTAVTFQHHQHQEILHGGDVGLATWEKKKREPECLRIIETSWVDLVQLDPHVRRLRNLQFFHKTMLIANNFILLYQAARILYIYYNNYDKIMILVMIILF